MCFELFYEEGWKQTDFYQCTADTLLTKSVIILFVCGSSIHLHRMLIARGGNLWLQANAITLRSYSFMHIIYVG